LNPLAVLAGLAPAAVGALFTRDAVVPLLLLCLSLGMLLVGVLLSVRQRMGLLLGLPVGVVLSAAGFSLWADGPLTHAVAVGVATALRLAALVSVALCAGLAVDGAELARALTAQLRIPYRFGYAAVAALRFVPRFAGESSAIRQAQRVRGGGAGRGPLTAVRNAAGTVVPLLASSIRHADRVALAMESRAFGAHATRTERRPSLWRVRDTLFVTAVWSATAAILLGPAVLRG
jgi:energy-coupling factor transporter transmembrane protein EcfT